MASRVTESITKRTFFPWSRKYSLIARARKAARMRSGAGRSEVATTTTLLRIPSGPSSCSINPRTSRLRSPISAITATSAELCRTMVPNSVLLPTPDPPKMPIRWPRPQGSNESIARMPVISGSEIGSRSIGPGAGA